MVKRTDSALELRDSGLVILRAEGTFKVLGWTPILEWQKDGMSMSYRAPFLDLPPTPEHLRFMAAIAAKRVKNLSHGLDIWDREYGGKVLNIEWNDEGDVELVSFRRGPWEVRLHAIRTTCER